MYDFDPNATAANAAPASSMSSALECGSDPAALIENHAATGIAAALQAVGAQSKIRQDEILCAALALAADGYSVIPVHAVRLDEQGSAHCTCGKPACSNIGKHPAISWTHWQQNRACDAQIKAWFGPGQLYAGYNIGVVTGAVSGRFVVDVDCGPGKQGSETLGALQLRHEDLPETVRARTGGGGQHLFFRHPGVPVKSAANALGEHVDVRGEGGFVVVSPSLHGSGNRYEWVSDPKSTDLAEAPEWLLEMVTDPVQPFRSGKIGGGEILRNAEGKVYDGRDSYALQIVSASILSRIREHYREPSADDVFQDAWPTYAENTLIAPHERDHRGEKFLRRKIDRQLKAGREGAWPEYQTTLRTAQELAAESSDSGPPRSGKAIREPSLALLSDARQPAPEFPLQLFGQFWSDWIGRTAECANSPPDYVALPLFGLASTLIGNARWPLAWNGWTEPPTLYCCNVGEPSSSKSPGAAPVVRGVLRMVEDYLAQDHPQEHQRWAEVAKKAAIIDKQWEKDMAAAVAKGVDPPAKPQGTTVPPEPVRPRVRVGNVTAEELARLLEANPKGLLVLHDELSGLFQNFSRYSHGTDRPLYLEAYNGHSYPVDRKNSPPLHIPYLTLAIFGGIQPDRLTELLDDADDGLLSRFLWAYPEMRPFRRPNAFADVRPAGQALIRLVELRMAPDALGRPTPSHTWLDDDAAALLERFAIEMQTRERQAHGILKSAIGKARGQALRLGLVMEYLWWCGKGGSEPVKVSRAAMQAAIHLMTAYFVPMASRVLGAASVPQDEKDARVLARWIAETGPARINVSAIREDARLAGLRDSKRVKEACRFLVEAGWLIELSSGGGRGRPRGDFDVNPQLFPLLPPLVSP